MNIVNRRLPALVVVLAFAVVAAQMTLLPSSQAADASDTSIVHIQGSDVWLTSPDGTHQAQVTSDGATPSPDGTGDRRYKIPSQSDDGSVIVAIRNQSSEFNGDRGFLWVMNRRGEVIRKLNPPQFEYVPPLTCPTFEQLPQGIERAAVSPDGTKIVYEPRTIFRSSTCGLNSNSQVHVINIDGSDHKVLTRAVNTGGSARLQTPSWASNTRILTSSDEGRKYYANLPSTSAYEWGSATQSSLYPVFRADRLATVGPSFSAARIDIWSAPGGPPAALTLRCQYTQPAAASGRFYLLTMAPDGQGLAWQEATGNSVNGEPGEGIWVAHLGDITTTCPTSADARLIVPNGMEPYWGPAPSRSDSTFGDYDGDGDTDIAVFRPSDGYWFVDGGATTQFGTDGDIPVPGDYDGDGDTDVAVFRPSDGYWFVDGGAITRFGTDGDIPVPGDYDGDGDTDVAVFRPSNGYWFVDGGAITQFGTDGDIPVPGDYDGDGATDVAVFRPSDGYWFVNGGAITQFGTDGDVPVPGDYDGDGATDVAVFRPSNGYWFVDGGAITQFGTDGDVPVPGDYDGDGATDVAVFRPSSGYWFVDGGAISQFGTSGDIPLPIPDAIRRVFFAPL